MSKHAEQMIECGEQALKMANIVPGSLWRHWKGELVTVIGAFLDEALLTPVVGYTHRLGEVGWTRTLSDFTAIVTNTEGQAVPRFTPYTAGEKT